MVTDLQPDSDRNIFLIVKNHLLTQKKKSLGPFSYCMYRNADGFSCAVGALINDECYSSTLENNSVSSNFVKDALQDSGVVFGEGTEYLLAKLQVIHDDEAVENWAKVLDDFEKGFFTNA